MMHRTGAQIILDDMDVLEGYKLDVFDTEIQVLRFIRSVGHVHVVRRVKNARPKNDVV